MSRLKGHFSSCCAVCRICQQKIADSIVAYATYPSWFENIEVYEWSTVLFFGYFREVWKPNILSPANTLLHKNLYYLILIFKKKKKVGRGVPRGQISDSDERSVRTRQNVYLSPALWNCLTMLVSLECTYLKTFYNIVCILTN